MHLIKKTLTKDILKKFCIFVWSLYTGLLLSPLIKLKYSNPYEMLGPLTNLQYNASTNLFRYLFLLIFVPFFFFLIEWLIKKKKFLFIKIMFATTIFFCFFISSTSIYLDRANNIDMFHDGEQLGVGSALFLFNKIPYKDTFFLHGAFTDPLIAFFCFKVFGYSIGSFYLGLSLLNLFTVLFFLTLLILIIKNDTLFYAATLFFGGSLYTYFFYRDFTSFLFILLAYFITAKKIKISSGIFITSFLSFITFYISMDRGYYLFFVNSILTAFLLFSSSTKTLIIPAKIREIFFILKNKLKIILSYLFGNLAAIMLGVSVFGINGFKEFILITFVQINKMKPFLDEYIYPTININSIFPFWLPIILNILIIIFLVKQIKLKKSFFIFPSILVFMSIVYFRNALGRSDFGHIMYIAHFIFLTVFILLDFFIKKQKSSFIVLPVIFLLFITNFFDKNIFLKRLNYSRSDVKIFFNLPNIDDNFWLNSEKIEVSSFIKKNTSKEDSVLVFTNEAAYYYLISRKSPTRFYTIWFASPNFFQSEALSDLEKNKPKYIIYKSDYWSNKIDGIYNQEKLKLIDRWIQKEYKPYIKIYSTEIYSLK